MKRYILIYMTFLLLCSCSLHRQTLETISPIQDEKIVIVSVIPDRVHPDSIGDINKEWQGSYHSDSLLKRVPKVKGTVEKLKLLAAKKMIKSYLKDMGVTLSVAEQKNDDMMNGGGSSGIGFLLGLILIAAILVGLILGFLWLVNTFLAPVFGDKAIYVGIVLLAILLIVVVLIINASYDG